MLNNLLSMFNPNDKATVGVAVTPGIGLEMIEIDRGTGTVSKYASRPLEYNFSTREIVNYDEFRVTLIALFDELKIPRNSNINLTLPTVHFGLISLPIMLNDEAVTNAIISEVEQTYLFKRQEPVVSWTNVVSPNQTSESTQILYSAIQSNALSSIYAACSMVGCNLLNIETSYLSLLKTLSFTGLAEEQMKDMVSWNLMVVGQNNYSIISMSGKNVIGYYEEPIALKSFAGEEVYNAIISSSNLALTTNPASWLYVISETDLVSAEVLSNKISFDGQITYLESNKYVQRPLIETNKAILPNLALKITPEIIGSGIYQTSSYPIKLNMAGTLSSGEAASELNPILHIGNVEVELSPAFVKKATTILTVAMIVPMVLIFLILNILGNKFNEEMNTLNTRFSTLEAEMKQYEDLSIQKFDEKTEVAFVNAKNKEKLIYYEALSLSIPPKTWITKFKINDAEKVFISGKTARLEDVYNFYRDLKMSVIDSDIKVNALETVENDDDTTTMPPKFYSFEITNMTTEEVMLMKKDSTPQVQTPEGENQNPAGGATPPTEGTAQPPQDNDLNKTSTPPSTTPSSNNNGLPPNLEKIESF